jgi:hypothetical protein
MNWKLPSETHNYKTQNLDSSTAYSLKNYT